MSQRNDPNKEFRFKQLMAANKAVVAKVCYMYATDADHFKDLCQETYIKIWEAMDRFRGESAEGTWIYRITINTCVSCWRKTGKHSGNRRLDADADVASQADMFIDDSAQRQANLREIYALINRLGALDKAIVLLWLDEKSYQEIADVTGLSRTNVAARLSRAKQKLIDMSNR